MLQQRRAWTIALLCSWGVVRADLAAVIATVRASVLPVGTFNPLDSPRFTFRGSGFVVGDGNSLITNFHVLPGNEVVPVPQLAVMVRSGNDTQLAMRKATLIRSDPVHDLALLRLEGDALTPLSIAEPGMVREGMDIALMGYPIGGVLGLAPVTHRGIISSITRIALPSQNVRQLNERAIARLREGPFPVYQLDATAYPGNSGGPLLDAHSGQVIGIINMVLVRNTRESALSNPTGITYAIPSQFALELLQERR